jgi:hypothetical protein
MIAAIFSGSGMETGDTMSFTPVIVSTRTEEPSSMTRLSELRAVLGANRYFADITVGVGRAARIGV